MSDTYTHYHYIAQENPDDDVDHMWECNLNIQECMLAEITLRGKTSVRHGDINVTVDYHNTGNPYAG